MTAIDATVTPWLLAEWICDVHKQSLALIADLTDEQLIGPRLATVNPLLWEIGHVAWFQEKWLLRHFAGREPIRPGVDALYDSIAIRHDVRWDLPLPSRDETLRYTADVQNGILDLLERTPLTGELAYFVRLAVLHADMHTEAFTYTRQTRALPPPQFAEDRSRIRENSESAEGDREFRRLRHDTARFTGSKDAAGDVEIPGGTFLLGSSPDEPFVFDNEKWAHPVEVRPFAISPTAVTQAEFAAFVEEGGYRRRDLWSEAGWQWRESVGAEHPVYWQPQAGGRWLRRDFDRWVPLEPHRPVIHVNWYEAEAWCRWAGRRLPSEAEWELAASAALDETGRGLSAEKRRFPWGNEPPNPGRANLDWRALGTLDVTALPHGAGAFGCLQMIGNVWEWTASDFLAYPGFAPDPYKEYSQPCFGDRKVLRGGCWATRARLIHNTYRNFYRPDRRDVWAGFRTCALQR